MVKLEEDQDAKPLDLTSRACFVVIVKDTTLKVPEKAIYRNSSRKSKKRKQYERKVVDNDLLKTILQTAEKNKPDTKEDINGSISLTGLTLGQLDDFGSQQGYLEFAQKLASEYSPRKAAIGSSGILK